MKTCKTCNQDKDLSQFRQYSNHSFRYECKSCTNEYDKKRKKSKRASQRQNTYKICEMCNKSKNLNNFAKLKKNYKKNICLECYPKFLTNQKTEWCRKERIRNPHYRIKKSLAARLRNVMNKGENKTLDFIGSNIQHLNRWLEYNFTNQMNWNNYGEYWNIDHIIPCAKFDLTKEEDKFLCWNWTNLCPMIAKENSSKKNNINQEQINYYKKRLQNFLKEKGSETKWFSVEQCILLKI